jgi:pyrroloquinoline quinone biosynthesis protein D
MQNTAIDLQSRPAPAPRVRLQADPVNGEPVLLYPEGFLRLNATAHEVLTRCDGKTSVGKIVDALCAEYEASAEQVRADVLECLSHLHSRQLITLAR